MGDAYIDETTGFVRMMKLFSLIIGRKYIDICDCRFAKLSVRQAV